MYTFNEMQRAHTCVISRREVLSVDLRYPQGSSAFTQLRRFFTLMNNFSRYSVELDLVVSVRLRLAIVNCTKHRHGVARTAVACTILPTWRLATGKAEVGVAAMGLLPGMKLVVASR